MKHDSNAFGAPRHCPTIETARADDLGICAIRTLRHAAAARACDMSLSGRIAPAALAAAHRQLRAYLDLHARFGLAPLSIGQTSREPVTAQERRFADLVATACAMERGAALLIAMELVRADIAPLAVSIAQQVGLHLMRGPGTDRRLH